MTGGHHFPCVIQLIVCTRKKLSLCSTYDLCEVIGYYTDCMLQWIYEEEGHSSRHNVMIKYVCMYVYMSQLYTYCVRMCDRAHWVTQTLTTRATGVHNSTTEKSLKAEYVLMS